MMLAASRILIRNKIGGVSRLLVDKMGNADFLLIVLPF